MTKYEPIIWDIETTGTNPMAQHWWNGKLAAQVTSVGIVTMDGWREAAGPEDVEKDVTVIMNDDEYHLLEEFEEILHQLVQEIIYNDREPFVVGWNSRNFDHPYIGARYARKRLENLYINHHLLRLDMMRALGNDEVMDKTYPSQDDYAEALGIEVYDELDGSDMPQAFERNQWHKIEQHVRADVDVLADIFVERREACFEEFYDHYDVDGDIPTFTEEVDF